MRNIAPGASPTGGPYAQETGDDRAQALGKGIKLWQMGRKATFADRPIHFLY